VIPKHSASLFSKKQRYDAVMDKPANDATPYYRLDPDTVLQAVESTGLITDGRLLALNSYENRVYQVGIDTGPAAGVMSRSRKSTTFPWNSPGLKYP
jgi:hypothetical protein